MTPRLTPIALACALLALCAPALADKTTGEYPACGKQFWLEAMLQYRDSGNHKLYERWLNEGRCIELHKGLDVTVVRYYGDAKHQRVEFKINGFHFFTVRKAIAKSL